MKKSYLFLPVIFLLFTCLCFAQTLAPGAPGKDAQWATAGKQGIGTSANLESKVWFTLAQGVLTEVYYPDVTVANVHLLQFVVVNPKTKKVETEKDDALSGVFLPWQEYEYVGLPQGITPIGKDRVDWRVNTRAMGLPALSYIQVTSAKDRSWQITKTYTTDTTRNTVLVDVEFQTDENNLNLYVYYDPSISNSGKSDTAWNENQTLFAVDGEIASALVFSKKITEISNGYYKTNDGLDELRQFGFVKSPNARAEKGNVVQLAKVSNGLTSLHFSFALSFGKTPVEAMQSAKASLKKGFKKSRSEYEKGWSDYLKTLPKVDPKYQAQFNMAAMILKAHEDKTVRGANIASLTVPWGGGDNANENNIGGYHLIWSRDLYQVATAFWAIGDKDAAIRALSFLFKVQQKPDGSFPQNSYLDGKPFWGSLQLDEVAYPLIMAHEFGVHDKETYEKHVKRAADFLVRNGPKTPQERWEEEGGYSPSTIAAEIAGLVCAAEIAKKNGDEGSATIYLSAADDWARNVDRWTATTNGKYGDGNYYLRIAQNGNPDAGDKIELNNGAGFFDEREIVDAGFLELVRLGIKSPDDPLIQKSLKLIDQVIKVDTPNGEAFYRYNNDGYGEMEDGRRWNWDGKYSGKGRLWALLSGERGQFELAQCDTETRRSGEAEKGGIPRVRNGVNPCIEKAQLRLDAMANFANQGLMIPEQIWDKKETPKNIDKQFIPDLKFGEGTGSATPLAWSMAQFIRLAVNLRAGRNLETPEIVYDRYVRNGVPGKVSDFGGTDEEFVLPVKAGEKFGFTRSAPKGTKIAYTYGGKTNFIIVGEDAKFPIEVIAPEADEIVVVGIQTPDGSTAFERVKVRSADRTEPQKFSAETIEKIKNAKESPLIEDSKAIFFYRGEAKRVLVAGDFSSWNPRLPMQKVGENLFAYQMVVANNARAEYKVVVDGKWMTDPLNQNKLDNGVGGENSFFAMPEYKPTVWDKANGQTKNAISIEKINSQIFGEREIQVYVPENYRNHELPVLYFQDGSGYQERSGAVSVQRNLVAAGKIKPFIMVFVDPKDRMKEYWANDDYAKFLATEIVPAIDAKYDTIKNREARAVLGASLGGITSVNLALKYPEVFSRIGGQSVSWWVDNERVIKELSKLDAGKAKLAFYFDDGIFEGVDDTRRVNVMLRGKGFPVRYIEGNTGHNWTAWRDRLGDAFIALWK